MINLPKRGDLVQRIDNKQIGRVKHIATMDRDNPPSIMPFYDGDIVVQINDYGGQIVCSGSIFWEKWELVDYQKLATKAIDIAFESDS